MLINKLFFFVKLKGPDIFLKKVKTFWEEKKNKIKIKFNLRETTIFFSQPINNEKKKKIIFNRKLRSKKGKEFIKNKINWSQMPSFNN